MDPYRIVDSGFATGDMTTLEPDERAFRIRERLGDPPYGHPKLDEWVARLAATRTATEMEDTRASDQHA